MMQFAQEISMQRTPLDIGQIARDHYDTVFRFCARRIGIDAASDAAQETFLTAQKVLSKFAGRSDLKTWLLGIAHNECRRLARKRRLTPEPLPLCELEGAASEENAVVDREILRAAFAKLSPEHRHVVLLREVEGLSYEEAGKILGIPEGTVKSRLHHAFLQLRKSLGDAQGDQS